MKNVVFTENFPSLQVVQAYLDPTVDKSEETFAWAKPDIEGLIEFARRKFGWTPLKSKEILSPVIKRMEENQSQRSIRDYFHTKNKLLSEVSEGKMSERVRKAVKRIANEKVDSSDEEGKPKKMPRKRKAAKKKTEEKLGEINRNNINDLDANKKDNLVEKQSLLSSNEAGPSKKRKARKPKAKLEPGRINMDADLKVLQKTRIESRKKLEEMQKELKKTLEKEMKKVNEAKAKVPIVNVHKPERIPQKEKEKADMLKTKLKAIETLRKSKRGPGYVKKGKRSKRLPKEDAGLSEESSEEDAT